MENNMAMEYPMFCYQCEQTAVSKLGLEIRSFSSE